LNIGKRITRDIDYCVSVADRATWDGLNAYLMETEMFQRDKNASHRFYFGEQTIDIIPFGGIQNSHDVQLDNPPIEVSVFGCREVAEDAEETCGGFKMVTFPGLCI
jgi:predicted nucleotidyltransferase